MTFADTKQILNGSPTAATDYFKGSTTDTLVGHFNAILFTKVTWSISIATWWGKASVASSSCWTRRNGKPRRILLPELPIS